MASQNDKPGTKIEDAIKAVAGHSVSEHTYGQYLYHEHDEDADHEHDEFQYDGPLEENPLWIQDNVTLKSVGVDIGSSGTQVIFSKIHLRRLSETSRAAIMWSRANSSISRPCRSRPTPARRASTM